MRETNQDTVASPRTQKHGTIRGQSRDLSVTFFVQKDPLKRSLIGITRTVSFLANSKDQKYLKQRNYLYQVHWKVTSDNETKFVWIKQRNVLVLLAN